MGFEEDKEEGSSVDYLLAEDDARDLLLVSPERIGVGERMWCAFFFNIYFQQLNEKIAKIYNLIQ